jgi:hypothetical protein
MIRPNGLNQRGDILRADGEISSRDRALASFTRVECCCSEQKRAKIARPTWRFFTVDGALITGQMAPCQQPAVSAAGRNFRLR